MALLSRQPPTQVATLAELVGVAHAVETEAIRCYRRLAEEMRRRGETDTAAAFDEMAQEEAAHVAAVERWAQGLGQPVPTDGSFRWRLPADLAESWDEVSGSAIFSPFRAYAIAVDNEQRAFAFYAYLAASAEDPAIAREAEVLAGEELRHAAWLRTRRRAAWRQEQRDAAGGRGEPEPPQTAEELAALVEAAEAEIAVRHRRLGRHLRGIGDAAGAGMLEALAEEAAARAGGAQPRDGAAARPADAGATANALALLLAAQRPLERLCTRLEAALLAAADERMQTLGQDALSSAISRIARIGRHIETLEPEGMG